MCINHLSEGKCIHIRQFKSSVYVCIYVEHAKLSKSPQGYLLMFSLFKYSFNRLLHMSIEKTICSTK